MNGQSLQVHWNSLLGTQIGGLNSGPFFMLDGLFVELIGTDYSSVTYPT